MAETKEMAVSGLLAVDVGNQITCFGFFCQDGLAATWSVTTPEHITVDEARLSVERFLDGLEGAIPPGARVYDGSGKIDSILSCVVPDLTNTWVSALAVAGGRRPLVVGPGLKTKLKMNYNDPSEVGSDRVADMVAAKERYGYPLIIIDCGTTVNFQVLDSDGVFLGGLIAPGLMLEAKALSQAAARLPIVEIGIPSTVVGKTTRESIQSGIVMGGIARIDGLVQMIWKELGYETDLVLAGENAEMLASLLPYGTKVDDSLTLHGLKLLYNMNRK